MNKRIYSAILLAIIFFGAIKSLPAQTVSAYQWFNPAAGKFPVIEGQAWANETNNFYGRLPNSAQSLVRPAVWSLSQNSAGEYINFKTSATAIIVRYKITDALSMPHMPATGVSGVDLYARDVNGKWRWARGTFNFGDTVEYRFNNLSLSAKEEEFRLYLPLYNTVSWMNIGVPAGATFSALQISKEKPIVMYGTSVMQGACASRPGLAWTNILGRTLNIPIINLGFSGNGQLEQPLIDLMNEINAQLYVLDCMPNLTNHTKFSKEEIQKRIITSVKSLQEKHSSIPILLTEHADGLANADMDSGLVNDYKNTSNILAETFISMQKEGIKNIYLLTDTAIGLNTECTVDGTHPNDIGMMKYADAYKKIIRQILHEEPGNL